MLPPPPANVLLLTADAIGARMAGPAIRAIELAHALHRAGLSPVVATPSLAEDAPARPFPVVRYDPPRARETLGPLLRDARAALVHVHALYEMPSLADARIPIVVDLYDPVLFERLEVEALEPLARRAGSATSATSILNLALRRGDFFVCASERQRDLWLGALLALGRITPFAVDQDASLRALIDVVPFGLSADPPARPPDAPPALKGVGPIALDHKVALWGGGIWNWFDPLTLVRAIGRIAGGRSGGCPPAGGRRQDLHLVFLGGRHPTPGVPDMRAAAEARELARGLGLEGRLVHFRDGWVPYEERARFLLDADVGVSTHLAHVESHFAFRTRLLDCLWAGLPIVCTRGDVLADLVEREGLGITVPARDEGALAAALESLAFDAARADACRARIRAVAPRFHWDEVARPLVEFARAPRVAADRTPGAVAARGGERGRLLARSVEVLRREGPGALLARTLRWLRLSRP